jgi:hypothetical protein
MQKQRQVIRWHSTTVLLNAVINKHQHDCCTNPWAEDNTNSKLLLGMYVSKVLTADPKTHPEGLIILPYDLQGM